MITNSLIEFISFLHSQGIDLSTDGKNLLCDGPEEVLTKEIVNKISKYKSEILNFLQKIT